MPGPGRGFTNNGIRAGYKQLQFAHVLVSLLSQKMERINTSHHTADLCQAKNVDHAENY